VRATVGVNPFVNPSGRYDVDALDRVDVVHGRSRHSRTLALCAVGWFDAYVAHWEVVEVVGEDDCAVDSCGSRDERVG
jgi:hypothetical protein